MDAQELDKLITLTKSPPNQSTIHEIRVASMIILHLKHTGVSIWTRTH